MARRAATRPPTAAKEPAPRAEAPPDEVLLAAELVSEVAEACSVGDAVVGAEMVLYVAVLLEEECEERLPAVVLVMVWREDAVSPDLMLEVEDNAASSLMAKGGDQAYTFASEASIILMP